MYRARNVNAAKPNQSSIALIGDTKRNSSKVKGIYEKSKTTLMVLTRQFLLLILTCAGKPFRKNSSE